MNQLQHKKGFAALLVVVIVTAAMLTMAIGAALLGIGELDLGYVDAQGSIALSVADGCMDESLRRLQINTNFATSTLSLGDGTCIIGVTSAGSYRTSTVTSTVGNYNRKLQTALLITNSTTLNILSWKEITDF